MYDLWNEWEHGIGGRKAAKKINAAERGMQYVKHNFTKRKPFWVLVNSMCFHGHMATADINLILEKCMVDQKQCHIFYQKLEKRT